MKRLWFMSSLALATVVGVVFISQKPAFAVNCNTNFYCQYGVAHTYFSQPKQTSSPANIVWARWDVFPNSLDTGPTGPVVDANSFINYVGYYLWNNNAQSQNQTGAALVIDAMMGYHNSDKNGNWAGGGQFAGLQAAQNAWISGTWQALVQSYQAANADPSSPYKVYWNYSIPRDTFCGSIDTGFDWTKTDEVFYQIPTWASGGCPYPVGDVVVRFQFPGGTFDIDRPCGNLSGALNAVPVAPTNHPPSGTLSISCNAGLGQEVAAFTYSDADGATTAYITASGQNFALPASPGNFTIPQSATDPYMSLTVSLSVKDVGPGGSNAYVVVATAPTQVPCAQSACSIVSVAPSPLDPYMRYSITVQANNNVNKVPNNPQFSLTITPPAGGQGYVNLTQNGSNGGAAASNSSTVFSNLGPSKVSGLYTITGQFTGAGGVTAPCNGTFPVVYLPYLNVYGGDVMVGTSPSVNGGALACGSDASAGVFSWNNRAPSYSGAGAQFAVMTLGNIAAPPSAKAGQILDFASALSSSDTPPTDLSLANSLADPNKLNPATGLFGGYFGAASSDCDFTSDLTVSPTNADLNIAGHTVSTGTQEIDYVTNHDVYISGNITYAGTGGWASPSQIPYFKVVVTGGDIYINSNVQQLDGIYVAEPSAGVGGRIFTCASAIRTPVNLTTAGAYTTCNKQLVITGAFVAKYVSFGRTFGSVGQATAADSLSSNHDAEVFSYTPEIWLPRSAGTPGNSYTAITGLPPVL